VASIPAADPYVDAVLPSGAVRVGPGGSPSPWLDEAFLTAHAREVDVLHVHGGYGYLPVAALESWAETVRRLGIPLVVTVHQLRDPAQRTGARHEGHLAALLSTAEVVLTLTPGAADDIAERYGRTAIVVAHPSLAVPVPGLGAERGLVGVVLRAPSPALPDPAAAVRAALSGAVSGGGRLRVLIGAGTGLEAQLPELSRLVAEGALEAGAGVADDAAWARRLQQLHVAVLAESCGTHSRDLEVCRDVGTRVVAPSCGWFADQWSEVVTYGNDEEHGLDAVSLSSAVTVALARPMPRPADPAWRAEQAGAVRRVHEQVYAQVAADRARV
jgi:hypothetical protein